MTFLSDLERRFLKLVSEFAYCNPFLPEHHRLERELLGDDCVEGAPVWSQPVDEPERPRVNVWKIFEKLGPMVEQIRGRPRSAAREGDLAFYEDAVIQFLYQRYYPRFLEASFGARDAQRWRFYKEFLADWDYFFEGATLATGQEPVHTFACFRQIQRAFEQIFRDIIGASMPAARLRASVWQSIFTHDMRRYRRTLYDRMHEFATLITGPSGTGKELAARAIAQSRYVPFDAKNLSFAGEDAVAFYPINISALSPALVESELFGHRRGSFTGAIGDRKGWLETCPALGSVFLDELGDMDPSIQVKLLRVIETRTFHPVGETAGRRFHGKLIAATNRDLEARIQAGEFREDLYYRLCSDQIATPSLADQLADSPEVLDDLIRYMARRVAGPEAGDLARDVAAWVDQNLGRAYQWPGNYRELDQCIRNVLIRRDYRPSKAKPAAPLDRAAGDFRQGSLTAEELLSRYATIVYSRTGSYEETARRLGIDRRTVKSKVDPGFLSQLGRA